MDCRAPLKAPREAAPRRGGGSLPAAILCNATHFACVIIAAFGDSCGFHRMDTLLVLIYRDMHGFLFHEIDASSYAAPHILRV